MSASSQAINTSFLTPPALRPEIRVSRQKCIPEKKSISVIMRPGFCGRVGVSIHSFLERRDFLSFTLQLKSKPNLPRLPSLPSCPLLLFCPVTPSKQKPAAFSQLPRVAVKQASSPHPRLAKVISSSLAQCPWLLSVLSPSHQLLRSSRSKQAEEITQTFTVSFSNILILINRRPHKTI